LTAWTYHGGRLGAARAAFGGDDWLDLSTGINPHAWPGVADIAVDWTRLPDEAALGGLERVAATYFGVDPEQVCALPGTEIGLRLASAVVTGPAAYVGPSYRTHGEMLPGARAIAAEALGDSGDQSVILANPNNPDGSVTSPVLLAALLDQRRHSPHWLVVDEAFADTDPTLSMASRIGEDRRLLIFRSFGKFFGLAGVRLGFVLGPRVALARVRARLGSWPVSSAALAIGAAAYADHNWIVGTRDRLRDEAATLDVVLARHGLAPRGACPLFRLVEVPDAGALFERLARQAILTRPFEDQPGWLRIGLPGSAAALERLDKALRNG
jgi:cobalamin biosynthesis protein CobC